MHLLSAEDSPRTWRGEGHLAGCVCKELARVGAGGRAALETSPAPGQKSTLCVSVAELSWQNTWFGLHSPVTANLFPFEKYPVTLYSLFTLLRSKECQNHISRTDLYLSYQVCYKPAYLHGSP